MKDLIKELGVFFWEVLKDLEWQTVLYDAYVKVIRPKLEAKVADSASKWDDVVFKGLDSAISKWVKPE